MIRLKQFGTKEPELGVRREEKNFFWTSLVSKDVGSVLLILVETLKRMWKIIKNIEPVLIKNQAESSGEIFSFWKVL